MVGREVPPLALLFVFTSAVAAASGGGDVLGDEAARNVSLVIKYKRDWYGNYKPLSAFCMTSSHQSLSITGLPMGTYVNPSYDTKDSYKTAILSNLYNILGVTCSTRGNQPVISPLIHAQALLTPDRRKVTLNKGEDLQLQLSSYYHITSVKWRKESSQNPAWETATLTSTWDRKLTIPSNKLKGSGLYSVVPQSWNGELTAEQYGVFVVVVRECPAQRYGRECEKWCPDCLHGGECDATSGECLCPAGVMGHRCQTRCNDSFIGSNCAVPLQTAEPKGQVVCTGGLMGCTCAPGYYGKKCEHECPDGRWGVDCKQTCSECERKCSYFSSCKSCSLWGHCKGTETRLCGQGDLGLPRLRQPPSVSSETPHGAIVSFTAWKPDYDDGELPPGGTILYYLNLTSDTNTGTTIPVNATSTELFNLTPDTTYHVKVLAAVMVNGRQCDAGSDRRGRVHTATFTTLPCPAPPQPETFTSVVPSNTSLDVQWQEVNYEDGCDHYYYYLLITPDASGKHRYHLNNHKKKVEGLQANTEYTISLQTCDQKWKHCSSFLNTTSRTLPGNLFIYKDQVSQDDHVLIRWGAASGNINNLKFRTKYEIEPEGYAAPSSWSHWNSNRSRLIEVFPFSVLQMLVQAKNDEGEGQVWTKKFTIPPSEPGQVRDLSVKSGINFLTLRWEKPDDKPPKGILESFMVSWGEIDKRDTYYVILSASRRQYIIRNLNFNTEYRITIQAKNQNVLQDGAVTTITATTGLPVPRRINNLKAEGTESSLTLTWREPSRQNNLIIYYRVLLYNASGVLQQNITVEESQAELEGLSHSQQYLVKVAACNKRYCSPVETLEQPAPPRLQETVNLVASNDTTITILMPLLSNPPGTHTVVVQREGHEQPTQDWKEALKDKAMALLKEGGVRSQLPPMQVEADGTEVYIAAKVEQEGDERLKVTVGGGTTAGHLRNPALHKDAAYWVVVVTEKRNGGYVVRVTSTPRRFVASTSTFPGWIVGLLFGLAALAIVAAAMVLCRRKCRGRSAEGRVIVGTPDSLTQPVDAALPMVPINAGQTNNCTEDIYGNATHQVKLKDIEGYLLRAVMSRDTKIEFENVPSFLCNAYTESSRPENRSKNRYRNKVPYDDTRVILPLHNHVPHSDYINANYVQSPTRTAAFIAAEGPMQETVGAFWRMVWHTNCPTVLMVANLMEGKKVKVAQYWPEQHPWTVEGVTVTPTDVSVKMDFVIRTFTISVGSVNRKVSQYQYTTWPDHGVPSMPYGLAQMIKLVRSEHAHHKPVAVHCSAGIGRTGTVILVMYLLDELQAHGAITPVEALTTLRRGRGRLVENSEQYIFAHQVLHEILFGMDTSYQCHSFQENLTALYAQLSSDASSPLNRQYQKLQSLPKDLSFIYGKDPTCAHLNRHQDILPADSRLVMVQGEGQGTDSHYLNVIRINTVDRKDAYLAGEHPQRHTLGKMWRLVYERSVAVWVLLHSFPGNDPEFPDVACESSEMLGNMTLKVGPTQAFQYFYERQVDISVRSLGRVNNHKCLLLSLRGWPAADCLPASPEPLLAVIERMEALCSLNQPPLFTCKDGVTGCGVMAALLLAVSRTKLMQQVDIYRSVASVQQDRPQFVVNLEQYIFLHSAMAAFLTSNNQYGNFA